MSASIDELRTALRDSLEAQGVLGEMRAKLRGEIYRLIDASGDLKKPDMPPETAVVVGLVREFLEFSGYSQTLSVFDAETGVKDVITKDMIAGDLKLTPSPDGLPLIYNLVEALKRVDR